MISHAIRSFRERLDNQVLFFFTPFPHPWVRVDDDPDIFDDVLLLSILVMKGYEERDQRLEDDSDVDLWATCDAQMKIRKPYVGELLYKLEDLFPRRWNAREVGTLVERVDNNIDWALIGE